MPLNIDIRYYMPWFMNGPGKLFTSTGFILTFQNEIVGELRSFEDILEFCRRF